MRPPSAFEFVVLSLAVFRATRFLGWDEWPPLARLRAWALGEFWVDRPDGLADAAYRRPTLAHLVHCPFCLSAWVTLVVYGLWLAFPVEVMYAAAGMALAGGAGLIAKNWDA